MTSTDRIDLPNGFEDFAPFGHWALATQSERKRHHFEEVSFDEIRAFYDFGHAPGRSGRTRLVEALAYLDGLPLDTLPPDAQRLMWILLSFAEITPTVEAWGSLNFYRACAWDKFPPTPECESI